MSHDTAACTFPSLTSDVLRNSDSLIDSFCRFVETSRDEDALAALRLTQTFRRRIQHRLVLPGDMSVHERKNLLVLNSTSYPQ